MIIMKAEATKEEIASVVKEIKKYGLKADVSQGEFRTVIGLIGDERRADFSHLATLPGPAWAVLDYNADFAVAMDIEEVPGQRRERNRNQNGQ